MRFNPHAGLGVGPPEEQFPMSENKRHALNVAFVRVVLWGLDGDEDAVLTFPQWETE